MHLYFSGIAKCTNFAGYLDYVQLVPDKEVYDPGDEPIVVCVEGYRNEREKVNLMYWQLTCECFFTPAEWEWIFQQNGYTGDYDFVFFE